MKRRLAADRLQRNLPAAKNVKPRPAFAEHVGVVRFPEVARPDRQLIIAAVTGFVERMHDRGEWDKSVARSTAIVLRAGPALRVADLNDGDMRRDFRNSLEKARL